MIGVAGGALAALLWGVSGFTAARSSRVLGAEVALAWVYLVGLCAVLPVALTRGLPDPGAGAVGWTVVTDVAAVTSLYLMYAALRRGPVVLVMPLTAAQGGLAAIFAVVAGEHLQPLAAVGLAIVFAGMLPVMRRPRSGTGAHPTAAVVLAALSAATAAVALFASPRAAHSLGTPWLIATLRAAGVLAVAVPLAASGRLRLPRAATRFVVFSGLADAGAFAAYIVAASRSGVAVPAVISSQYAAVSALLGVLALGERLTRPQLAGVVAILAGVALVTSAQA